MMTIKCNQLFTYCIEDYAVLELATSDEKQGIYLVNGSGELLYKCEDPVASDDNLSQLRTLLDSFSAIVVYDVNRLKKNNVTAAFLNLYQPMICDVAADLASLIGTMDIRKGKWLVRDLDEVLSFYRCEHDISEPVERAKAILWLAELVSEASSTELTIKREQKLKDLRKMRGYFLQAEGK